MLRDVLRWIGGMGAAMLLAGGIAGAAPLRVVATTSMVADLAKEVGGADAAIEGLMGPGVDPHLYKPTASDVLKLQRAEVVLYNGLLLEGRMTELFAKMSGGKRVVCAVAEALPADQLIGTEGAHHDPHVWFDVALWSRCVDPVVDAFSRADPPRAQAYRERGDAVKSRLAELHTWAIEKIAELPRERRILVTSHDAYGYFGRAYAFQVVGLQGISTASEAGLADMARLVDFIKARGVKAIFVESSVSPATIRRIAQDARVSIGGELFSDAMGTPGQIENGYDLGTYEGMVKHNVTTIVEALK